MTTEPNLQVDELLTAYADDPTSLTAAERAAVEARCAADPAMAAELAELRAVLTEVRVHGDVADAGPDWAALEAGIRAAVPTASPPRRRGRWLAGAGVALAAAAGLALWWQHRSVDTGPGLDLAARVPPPAAPGPSGPAVAPDDALDDALDALADDDDLGASDDELDDDDGDLAAGDVEALIGHALEPVPAAGEDGLFPGLDTDWIDELSTAEVEQALRWLDQQGAG